MPFDGSGNFVRNFPPGGWQGDATANIKIKADRHDQHDKDLADGLSNTLCKDGQSSPSADINWNGHKIVNLGAPINPTDAAHKQYVDTTVNQVAKTENRQQVLAKNADYTTGMADSGSTLVFTSASTLSLGPASALQPGWWIEVITVGNRVTIDPNLAELIDGYATVVVEADRATRIHCDGFNFFTNRGHRHAWELIKEETLTVERPAIEFKDLGAFRQLRLTGWILPEEDNKHLIYQHSVDNGATYLTGEEDYYVQYVWSQAGSIAAGPAYYHGLLINGDTMSNNGTSWSPGCSFVYNIFSFNQPRMNSCVTHAHNVRPESLGFASVVGLNAGYGTTQLPRNAFRIVADAVPAGPAVGNIAEAFYTLEGVRG